MARRTNTTKNIARGAAPFLCCLICIAPVCAGANAELDDLAARAQYAYYTSDAAALRKSLEQLRNLTVQTSLSPMKQGYLAYGEWKLSELQMRSDKEAAAVAAEHCVTDAEPVNASGSAAATSDLYALQSVCLGLLADLRGLRAPLYTRRRDKSLSEAARLDAKNPRVLLAQVISDRRDAADPAARDSRRAKLLDAVALFEHAAPADARADWGFVETLLALGHVELERGDTLAARNAVERALLLAPDYANAKTLMDKISVR